MPAKGDMVAVDHRLGQSFIDVKGRLCRNDEIGFGYFVALAIIRPSVRIYSPVTMQLPLRNALPVE